MAFTRIDNDQLKDLTITNEKISTSANIEQSKIQNLTSDLSNRVLKSGDTMTGSLVLSNDPVNPLEASTKQYVDNNFVLKAGDVMSGFLTLNSDPVNPLEAATKQYVDGQTNSKLPLNGGTLTGPLTLSADPTNDLEAATKQYVDNLINNTVINALPGVLSGGICSTSVVTPSTIINITSGLGTSVNGVFLFFPTSSIDLSVSGAGGLETSATLSADTLYYLYIIFPNDLSSFSTIASVSPTTPDLPLGYDDYINLNMSILTYSDVPNIYVVPFETATQGTRKSIIYTSPNNFTDNSNNPDNVGLTCISTFTGSGSFDLIDISALVSANSTSALISISCSATSPGDSLAIRPTGATNSTIISTNNLLGLPVFNKFLINLNSNKTFELQVPTTTTVNLVIEGYLV